MDVNGGVDKPCDANNVATMIQNQNVSCNNNKCAVDIALNRLLSVIRSWRLCDRVGQKLVSK